MSDKKTDKMLETLGPLALDADRRPEFSRAVYTAEFGGAPSIGERAAMSMS